MAAASEREAPDQAGKRLQEQLDTLLPRLQVPHSAPRPASAVSCILAWGRTAVKLTHLCSSCGSPHRTRAAIP
jgi:hypothetical protein